MSTFVPNNTIYKLLNTINIKSNIFFTGLLFIFPYFCFSQIQNAYPNHSIKIVIPFTPGGVTDMLGRDIGQFLSSQYSNPVIVENKAGANGNIGADFVAKAKPDGYTLLVTAANIAISQASQKKLPFQLFNDFSGITLLAKGPYILVTPSHHKEGSLNSLNELISKAKTKPFSLSMASSGSGSAGHLAGELLQNAAEIKFTHIPYKGQSEAMADILSGESSSLFFATVAVVSPHLSDGRLNVIAVTTKTRSNLLPQVPSIGELGFPGFDVSTWHGLFAPSGTPKEIIEKLNSALTTYLNSSDMQKKYSQQGLQITTSKPGEFTDFLHAEVEQYEKVIRKSNIQF
jgi:tripartite-type tricarboxylate transporter receptor subunit TctC